MVRITTPHIPLPAADNLEDLALPSAPRIAETIRRSLKRERMTTGKIELKDDARHRRARPGSISTASSATLPMAAASM